MRDQDLLDQLEVFEPSVGEGVRAVRRPAGVNLLVEFEVRSGCQHEDLASFWLASLWRFLEDSRANTDAFEGLAFQALAEPLNAHEFEAAYGPIRASLTLPPPFPVELRRSYRVLNGRLVSFAGVTTDGEMWAGFFQANVYELSTRGD